MDALNILGNVLQILGAVGLLEFIKFLINRKDHKVERQEDRSDRKSEELEKIRKEFYKGLDEREQTGKERFDINSRQIENNSKRIDEVLEISNQLKDNVLLLTNNISQMQEYNTNVGEAVQGIIRDRIVHNIDGFIDRNGITTEERATLRSMYEPYTKLGDNDEVKTAFEEAMKLPTITKEEAIKRDISKKREVYEKC